MEEILKYFPEEINKIIKKFLETSTNAGKLVTNDIHEIRIRVSRSIILKLRQADLIIDHKITEKEILQILERICENSIYAYKNQISEGYITVKGGHRIGVTGTGVIEDGKIINIKYISSLNFRIAREIKGCGTNILRQMICQEKDTIYNSIIVSPPGRGKTTILRDIIRQISNGAVEIGLNGKNCGVVDERGEIAACFHGIPQNDIGIRTDIIENVSKSQGIIMLIRSMSPEIIACDEIGTKEDVEAIKLAICSGVKGIFTMHGENLEDIKNCKEVGELIENKIIQKIFFLP